MSRIFEALQQSNPQMVPSRLEGEVPVPGARLLAAISSEHLNLEDVATFDTPTSLEARLVAFAQPYSLTANKFKAMAARLRHRQQVRGLKKILVTSATCGDGKTTASANLAITLAAQDEKTLLIDGDLHQPALHKLLQVDNDRGFSDWQEDEPITKMLRRAKELPLWFLSAGSGRHPLMIQSAATPELLKQLSSLFSWIIIDSPPLVPLADSSIWNTLVDGVLLLVRQTATPKKILIKSLESFDKSKLLGLIVNDAIPSEEKYYRDYYSGSGGTKK